MRMRSNRLRAFLLVAAVTSLQIMLTAPSASAACVSVSSIETSACHTGGVGVANPLPNVSSCGSACVEVASNPTYVYSGGSLSVTTIGGAGVTVFYPDENVGPLVDYCVRIRVGNPTCP